MSEEMMQEEEMVFCEVCTTEHPISDFEQVGGGARVVDIGAGELLEKNWVDLKCLHIGVVFQESWFEGVEDEDESEGEQA